MTMLKQFIQDRGALTSLLKGGVGLMFVRASGKGLLFLLFMLLAHLMSLQEYGHYMFAFGVLQILALISMAGVDGIFLKYLPIASVEKNFTKLKSILSSGITFVFVLSAAVALVMVGLVYLFQHKLVESRFETLICAAVLLPMFTLSILRQAALRALKKSFVAELPEMFVFTLVMMLSATIALNMFGQLTALMVFYLTAFSGFVAFAVGKLTLVAALPKSKSGVVQQDFSLLKSLGLPFFFVGLFSILQNRIDFFLLGLLKPAEDVAVYSVTMRIAELSIFALQAAGAVLAPMISELYVKQDRQQLQKLLTYSARGVACFTLIVVCILVFAGRFILGFFGPEYAAEGYLPLCILLTGQVITTIVGSVGYLLLMTGRHSVSCIILFSALASNILLCCLFIPKWGAVGAATSACLTLVLWSVAMLWVVRKKLKLNPTVF